MREGGRDRQTDRQITIKTVRVSRGVAVAKRKNTVDYFKK